MLNVLMIGVVIGFAVMILVFIARAIFIDFRDAAESRSFARATRVGMDPLQKEIQRSQIVQISTRMHHSSGVPVLERRLGRTA
ncbi:MAG: hypothetical protein ACYC99_08845 [Candidatus Geothermincolia bacterium]